MKILVVGGAVRDMALGRSFKDVDYLVQGATEDEFLQEFPDARKVGNLFPVYLVDGDEYAFARTETKTGDGHNGFSTDIAGVSIEEDLMRRDLTINAMALCPETGSWVIGHPKSMEDLTHKCLRHAGPAFKDDPLRVFRVARFASELKGFTVAPETIELMNSMKDSLRELPAERVFREMEKALDSERPSAFFYALRAADCLDYWFPEVAALTDVPAGPQTGKHAGEKDTFHHTMRAMHRVPNGHALECFAVLCHDLGKALSLNPPKHAGHDKAGVDLARNLCRRLKVPKQWEKLACLFTKQHIRMHKILEMKAGKAASLLTEVEGSMQDGLALFLKCSVGDGMDLEGEAYRIMHMAYSVFDVSLPRKYYGQGKKCRTILHQLQCDAWKEAKRKMGNMDNLNRRINNG